MELSDVVRLEKNLRIKARKEAIQGNKMSPAELSKSMKGTDLKFLTHRMDDYDQHSIKIWTPELNRDFIKLPRLIGDRDPEIKRMERLKLKLAHCRLPVLWAIAYCESENFVSRINGNTTAMIAAAYPELFERAVIFYSEFMCSHRSEAELLYSQYDSRESSRSIMDALMPYVVAFGVTVHAGVVSPLVSAVCRTNTGYLPKTFEERLEWLHHSLPFLYWLGEVLPASSTKTLMPFMRICVASAIYAIWTTGRHEEAKEFLLRSIYTSNYSYAPGDPCLLLNREILTHDGPKSEADARVALEQFSWVLSAWKAFVDKRKIRSTFRVYSGKEPPEVVGMSKATRARLKYFLKIVPLPTPVRRNGINPGT
jgi:hypothetical protein